MRRLYFYIILSIFKCVDGEVVVNTTKGLVKGVHLDYGSDTTKLYYGQADVFWGVPYAQPPVGEFRFKVTRRTENLF